MSSIRDNSSKELNRFDQAFINIKKDYNEHQTLFRVAITGLFMLAVITVSFIGQWWDNLTNDTNTIVIVFLFTYWLRSIHSVIFTLVVYAFYLVMFYRSRILLRKDYVRVEDEGESYMLSKETPYGDTHWQTKEEMCMPNPNQDGEVLCVIDKDYEKHTGDILGLTKEGEIVSLHPDVFLQNFNELGIGAAGSGKSAAGVTNRLISSLRRGESIVVTDTKGDLYRETMSIFKENGYIIRVLNFKDTKNSDGWEVMKYITAEEPMQADVVSLAIIINTLDTNKRDYWDKSEQQALKATLLLVATSPVYEGRRSFSEVINILAHPDEFESKFAGLPRENPAKIAFDNFMQAEDRNRGQVLQGLGGKLSLLNDPIVKEIVSNDEIDLTMPARKKCIYYVIMPDTDTLSQYVIAMFFAQIFQALCRYIDAQPKEVKKKKLKKVRFIIDEAKAVGTIPDFDVKISTFRSRKIYCSLFFQDFGQLADTYPGKTGKGWHDIVANSAIKILFKAGDPETAKFFQDLIGETTVKIVNGRYNKNRTRLFDVHDDENVGESLNKRYLLPAAKAIHLNLNRIVICIDGHQPIKLNKYLADKYNPIYLALSKETPPNRHKPKWRKLKEEEEKAMKEKLASLSSQDRMIVESEPDEKEKDERKQAMTIKFDNGDEVDMDTGEVVNASRISKAIKNNSSSSHKERTVQKHIPDVFDESEAISMPRKDIKKVKDLSKPAKNDRLAVDIENSSTNGDSLLDGLLD